MLDHLFERDRPAIKRRLRAAWKLSDHRAAIERLEAFAGELAHSHPGAAASLREGLAETVTLQRLGVDPQLHKTLSSTNPIERDVLEALLAVSRDQLRADREMGAVREATTPPSCTGRIPKPRSSFAGQA